MGRFDCSVALKALAQENRLNIMRYLLKEKRSVTELTEMLGLSQNSVSVNLRVLHKAGLVEFAMQRQKRVYAVAAAFQPYHTKIVDQLDLGCCRFDFKKIKG